MCVSFFKICFERCHPVLVIPLQNHIRWQLYDIRSWVEDYVEELHAHTVPKCFKFKRNDAGKAEMYYRNWSHEEWQGPVPILKVNLYHKLTGKTE